jgi:hypothetical protein
VAAFAAASLSCFAQGPAEKLPRRKANVVAMQGALSWTAEAPAQLPDPEAYFVLYPVLGLSDADNHQITEAGWKNMKSSGGNGVARLIVTPDVKFQDLQKALGLMASKGGYKTVQIVAR